MKKQIGLSGILSVFLWFLGGHQAWAVCPACTVAVGAGVGLSRWLGIDDTISGTWIGGLIVSFIVWSFAWYKKRGWNSLLLKVGTVFFWYFLVMLPLYFQGVIGDLSNTLWKIDKLILGILFGSALFVLGTEIHLTLKKRNGGHSYFPFQKVTVPVVALIALSLFFYFVTK